MARDCPACSAPLNENREIGSFPPTFEGRLSEPKFNLVECGYCQVVYLSPPPTEDDLRQLYVDTDQFDLSALVGDKAAAVGLYMDHCFARASVIAGATKARVLEVGAGPAWMCAAAKRSDAANYTVAQDVSPELYNHCPWADIYLVGEVSEVSDCDFDIASMTHVIEHLVYPLDVLKQIHDRLRPGGVLFVSAPYRPVGWASGDGPESWYSFPHHHVPGHVQYFSEKGLQILAKQAGFTVDGWEPGHDEGRAFEAYLIRS